MSHDLIGLLFDCHRTSVGWHIKTWGSKVGRVGCMVSFLDYNAEFLKNLMPQKFIDMKYKDVGLMVDGKAFMTEECRGQSNFKRICWNVKTNHAAGLMLDYTMPCGLSVYHSPLVCGHVTESSLVKFCCDQRKSMSFSNNSDNYNRGTLLEVDEDN